MLIATVLLVLFSYASCVPTRDEYMAALSDIDWQAVKADILVVLRDSKDFWPADYGNYGPFMIRQAWHCAGSYRIFDGRGGCDGGRQRFDPERSWDDNTNLDKAKTLLWPIKQKYGLGLSWGDLIILTANTAIESMGGPVFGFCAGRMDDYDGSASVLLGPTAEQEAKYPCAVNGQCKSPFGATTIGLIYVNPEGPMGVPLPQGSALDVRSTFSRMNMNDAETVALIGGGHAFGKTHGACPLGPGPSPQEDPSNPWPGKCGSGKGKDTFTSGFEGPWSTQPTKWGNYYFNELLKNTWEVHIGPGGKHQWRTVNGTKGIMMLTSDISLLNDPMDSYQNYVNLYANNLSALNDAFSRAWYKLTTRDMGPVTRCAGPWVPPAQPFQFPLPPRPSPSELPNFEEVRESILATLGNPNSAASYGSLFVHLAWQCASTFRHTDYIGGCNGARIRFPPQTEWPLNTGVEDILSVLAPIQQEFTGLSWADLIVLAGNVALDKASGADPMPFCAGRTDATDGSGSALLQPNGNYSATSDDLRLQGTLMSLTDREVVVLSARLRSASQVALNGYYGSWTQTAGVLSNEYFVTLLGEEWQPFVVPGSGKLQYKAAGQELYMLPSDLALKWDAQYLAIAQEYASDETLFIQEFAAAWTKLMNLDQFGGVCESYSF